LKIVGVTGDGFRTNEVLVASTINPASVHASDTDNETVQKAASGVPPL